MPRIEPLTPPYPAPIGTTLTTRWGLPGCRLRRRPVLEFLVLAGWYRTISYVANGLLLEEEPWGAPFPTR